MKKVVLSIIFGLYYFCCLKSLYSQEVKSNIIGGRFIANYSHTYLDDYYGIANAYFCHLSLIYGHSLKYINVPPPGRKFPFKNYLKSQPFLVGFKVDFEPDLSFTEKYVRKYYSVRGNPFFRIYSSFNLYVEAGLGIDFVTWSTHEQVPKINSINIPDPYGRDTGYYLEGGIGYAIRLTKKVTIDPVIIYRYRKGFIIEGRSQDTDILETKYGLYPYIAFQFYF